MVTVSSEFSAVTRLPGWLGVDRLCQSRSMGTTPQNAGTNGELCGLHVRGGVSVALLTEVAAPGTWTYLIGVSYLVRAYSVQDIQG
jgi:hypothetical protein